MRDMHRNSTGSTNNNTTNTNNKISSALRLSAPQQSLRRLGLCSQIATGEHSSPIVFPEKRGKVKGSRKSSVPTTIRPDDQDITKNFEHRIDIGGGGGGDEKSDLLGYVVFSGKLVLDKRKFAINNNGDSQQISSDISNQEAVDAKLTSKALVWGSQVLHLDDVISVSYNAGLRHFTVHSYPLKKASCGLSCFIKSRRTHKDFRFVASSVEEALQWVGGFADQQCFVNCLPHPLQSSKKQASSELIHTDTPPELLFRCKTPPKMLVILNPRSGRGRSSKMFHGIVEPIFTLAGFRLEVVKTTSAGHARNLASSVDISTCPDGIICVGGDGIINEVLNGLLSRDNQKEGISIPIGIIPAGSDNSLVWTVLGVRDPVSAAMAIVKGGLTATDVFAVEWIQTNKIHFGLTVSYYGFVSDVLELSEKYQKRFGPLRYFVAGFLKFLCLPRYSYEVEYLPASKTEREGKLSSEKEVVDMSDLYTDIMSRSNKDGMPRASSLSSIDSIMTPSRISGGDLDTCSSTHASAEPSELVRGLDPKSKRLSSGRGNVTAEPEVIHPQLPLSTTPNWPRTRSKSRNDKGWTGLTTTHDTSRWGNTATCDREDISSTLSDPGPIWDAEPKWDAEPNWDVENPIELPGPPDDTEIGSTKEVVPRFGDKWVVSKGQFLGILVCNHACRTVQSSQVVAPKAEHDDNTLDLLLVHGSGRLRLLRFFLLLQMGRHLSLPYVEYVKVKSVRIKPGKHTHNGCGIDGELFPLNGQVISSLLPEQCRLIGRFRI
ncbi:sphingoid long-chain bases kinase 1 isoform X1 [Abrus precatorius]|uniref:Sphingoid long-chain bases kinase 1 isoform X1 n=1 Tax=Abrus precatorius TaxID=3816 RepID=A0A8B8LQD9_ABRPR|nr:sphingoid long-chain bases kinase 1 isoform X1 [Abrus precatorius]XP_027358066.1 sphingoid long-chain bases kinase 1 isoform X1 [Abrus precatorius]XP_027358067.1 sphingoid long-chain bases kinase 1 isoform X1 [Abrus precatorius]